ncbi:MAG TPA: aminoglycoside adenylyltransferase domain-containing protein [Ktedonobacterales bacterium]|jgi:streptomycin 3"-adenylyltransferase
MTQYSWATCPPAARSQIEQFLAITRDALQENLTGVYLHGSLALGCFNPARSDLDLLVVTRQPMSVETKRAFAETLLGLSRNPTPIEISFLSAQDLAPWRCPTPFDLHYSESWRSRCEQALANDGWRAWNDQRQTDLDLAAHITVTRARGICLVGQSIGETFPPVPTRDYLAAIWDDFLWAREALTKNPTYFVLNACRVAAYLLEGRVCSKEEGGVWGLHVVPTAFRNPIVQALEVYRGGEDRPFDAAGLNQFGAYMEDWLRPFATSETSE